MTNPILNLPGKLIDNRYFLEQLIAQSSYNQVFLAKDLVENRRCLVKRLNLELCPSGVKQSAESMFEQEATILKQLNGKYRQISRFYSYFCSYGALYLVQEWILGITLEQKLQHQQKLSEPETREILLNLLSILEYIHRRGIVHRDIKPSNILLRSSDNLPVLIDFGAAQQLDNRHQSKIIAGTPGYMSLEQAMGQSASSNDLYSLGLTAIHLLTGQVPLNITLNHQRISISRNLLEVLSRAISAQPQQRFNSAQEMRAALLNSNRIVLSGRNKSKCFSKSWAASVILGLQFTGGVWMSCQYLAQGINQPSIVKLTELFPEESLLLMEDEVTLDPSLKDHDLTAAIFTLGTSNEEILQALGEPAWRKPGFWSNSIAWSYENIVSPGIDLGYMFSTQTNKLRQAEITVPASTNFTTIRTALNSMLSTEISPNIERGIEAVLLRRQTVYDFTAGDFKGIIKRNHYDRIYLAVWSADFH